jgi:hypothetical protein
MSGELLYGINEGLLLAFVAAVLYGCAELGYRYGLRYTERTKPEVHSHVATVEGALLGLLALLLGFAFAMAVNRYDDRKRAVLEEVNDLQTAYLRAQLLPPARSEATLRLLEEYVASRIEYARAGNDDERVRAAQDRSRRLQVQLWAEALAAAREDSNVVTTGYYITTLNQLIDDHTRRTVAMENHVPETILLLLVLVAALTMAVTGYSSGLRGKRLKALRFILVLLVAATLTVIIDLDRPRRGLIRVSESGMTELQQQLPDLRARRP